MGSGGEVETVEGGEVETVEGGEVETVEGGEVETVEGGKVGTVEGGKVETVNMGGERVDVNEVGRKRRREVEVMRRKAEAEKMSVRRLGRCIVEDLQKTYGGQSMKERGRQFAGIQQHTL